MRKTLFTIIVLFCYLASCSHQTLSKIRPDYPGVHPALKPLVNEYLSLSVDKHIAFSKDVTIGFKKIDRGNIIGICHYGSGWREIDIDIGYFTRASALSRQMLLFHELSHCYCDRDHDFGDGEKYPEATLTGVIALLGQMMSRQQKGYLDDGCPQSIMHPVILDDYCSNAHYNYYIEEMFNRCKPY